MRVPYSNLGRDVHIPIVFTAVCMRGLVKQYEPWNHAGWACFSLSQNLYGEVLRGPRGAARFFAIRKINDEFFSNFFAHYSCRRHAVRRNNASNYPDAPRRGIFV